ncbi:Ribosome bioproteinis GTPase [Lentibacillus sp. JNUCC-1]|uniref:ribosome biogenesis GTPase YlqF n=1 Tax=Lentibacillus sp. JNUCC-1 TaxID=2654513 RepID=UPI0012E83171|nr:ribosome biogenesis GTPase YlqF [Lentibacillus sp. JNUCC-1]MUV39983.1 Ribosome bioproteinis GTPase [Lentibacillus sp. JNUCC-1]
MSIQWYPGHMAKAKREVQEKIKLVDFVIELVDARAPESSQNPMLQQVLQQKPKLIILMKKDLADENKTEHWMHYFHNQGHKAAAVDVNRKQDINHVIQQAREISQATVDKMVRKGIKPRAMRAMIVGIPNVGKSTLINRLANKKIAKTGDKPGITQKQAWIKVKNEFDLLDTPGILWPKFEDEIVGYRLAAIGTIKDQLLSLQDIAAFALQYIQVHYKGVLKTRYGTDASTDDMVELFNDIGRQRGALQSGGSIDFDKVADIVLGDLRSGRLGRITLESPAE